MDTRENLAEFPSTRDQPDQLALLSGRNFAHDVVLSGWDGETIKLFTNFEEKLANPKKKSFEMVGEQLELLKGKMDGIIPLSQLALEARKENKYLSERTGVKVHVVAKKKVDTTVKDNCILCFGDLIIADESGWCTLKTFNDQIWTVYNLVEIGDLIYIEKGTYAKMRKSPKYKPTYPYSQDKMLDLEIRASSIQAKFIIILNKNILRIPNHLLEQKVVMIPNQNNNENIPTTSSSTQNQTQIVPIIIINNNNSSEAELPVNLFKLWKPSELVNNESGRLVNFPNYTQYIDILGTVSYVSRIERVSRYTTKVKTEETADLVDFVQFNCFRWLMIVDDVIKRPIKVKLYLNERNLCKQGQLTPKSVIIISNVRFDDLFFTHLSSSQYSTLYVNNEISTKYSDLFPERYTDFILKFRMDFTRNRKDVEWSAGGSLNFEIEDQDQFIDDLMKESKIKYSACPKRPLQLARREVRRFILKGKIVRYFSSGRMGQSDHLDTWRSPSDNLQLNLQMKDHFKYHCNLNSNRSKRNYTNNNNANVSPKRGRPSAYLKNDDGFDGLWYCFQRRMPTANFFREKIKRENFYEYYTERYGCLLKPLLIPAGEETLIEGDKDLKLCDLRAIDGEFLYHVKLVVENEAKELVEFFCLWKSSDSVDGVERMKVKLTKLRDQMCVCVIDIFCLDHSGQNEEILEVQLMDIVPNTGKDLEDVD